MKTFILIVSMVLLAWGADFEWIHDYQKALDLAKKEHKPVMVMISQPNCPTCEYMDDVAFETESLSEYVENYFIPLKLSLAKAKALGFKAYGTPTFYFLDANGSKITRALVGGATAKTFLAKLQEIRSVYAHQKR